MNPRMGSRTDFCKSLYEQGSSKCKRPLLQENRLVGECGRKISSATAAEELPFEPRRRSFVLALSPRRACRSWDQARKRVREDGQASRSTREPQIGVKRLHRRAALQGAVLGQN